MLNNRQLLLNFIKSNFKTCWFKAWTEGGRGFSYLCWQEPNCTGALQILEYVISFYLCLHKNKPVRLAATVLTQRAHTHAARWTSWLDRLSTITTQINVYVTVVSWRCSNKRIAFHFHFIIITCFAKSVTIIWFHTSCMYIHMHSISNKCDPLNKIIT